MGYWLSNGIFAAGPPTISLIYNSSLTRTVAKIDIVRIESGDERDREE